MKILVQRSLESSVLVDDVVIGKIESGLVLFVGFTEGDSIKEIEFLTNKVINLRIFDDENGVMNLSVVDVHGEIIVVSQFTLHASTKKGNRPSYINAAKPDIANKIK